MDIAAIKVFIVTARSSSFSQAAQRLGRSQQSVSSVVMRLEQELGNDVFVRSSQGIALTPFGAMLLEAAEGVTTSVQRLFQLASSFSRDDAKKSVLTIGASVTAAHYAVTDELFLQEFEHAFPAVLPVALACSPGDGLIALDEGRLDALVFASYKGWSFLRRYSDFYAGFIGVLPPVVALSCSDALADRTAITLADLRGRPFASLTHNGLVKLAVIKACSRRGFVPTYPDLPYQSARGFWEDIASGRAVSLAYPLPHGPHGRPGCTFIPLMRAEELGVDLHFVCRRQGARSELSSLEKMLCAAFDSNKQSGSCERGVSGHLDGGL